MKPYLDLLKQITSKDSGTKIKTFEQLDSSFTMNEGTSEESIKECDSHFDYILPIEYKSFLKIYNGGVFYQIEDFAGFQFFSINELIDENSFQKENFGADWERNVILFCLCIGDAEYIGFRFDKDNTYKIIYCIMDELPDKWQVIDTSFNNFVYKLLIEKGRKYWLD